MVVLRGNARTKGDDRRRIEQAWARRARGIGLGLSAFIGFATAHNLMVMHGSSASIDFSAAASLLYLCAFPANGVAHARCIRHFHVGRCLRSRGRARHRTLV